MKRNKILLALLGVAACAPLGYYLSGLMLRFLPSCSFSRWGILCPACGGTRFVRAFLGGRWGEAFFLHPYFFATALGLFLFLALVLILSLVKRKWAEGVTGAVLRPRTAIFWAVGFALFALVRIALSLW